MYFKIMNGFQLALIYGIPIGKNKQLALLRIYILGWRVG